jgi:hypothetical protein
MRKIARVIQSRTITYERHRVRKATGVKRRRQRNEKLVILDRLEPPDVQELSALPFLLDRTNPPLCVYADGDDRELAIVSGQPPACFPANG